MVAELPAYLLLSLCLAAEKRQGEGGRRSPGDRRGPRRLYGVGSSATSQPPPTAVTGSTLASEAIPPIMAAGVVLVLA
jgi:hypothetical protein